MFRITEALPTPANPDISVRGPQLLDLGLEFIPEEKVRSEAETWLPAPSKYSTFRGYQAPCRQERPLLVKKLSTGPNPRAMGEVAWIPEPDLSLCHC